MQRLIPFLRVLIALGALAGLYGGYKRWQVEQANRRVEMALEYADVKTLAEMTRQPFSTVLDRFKAAGITSIAIAEDTIGSLTTEGAMDAEQRGDETTVAVYSQPTLERIGRTLTAKGLPASWDSFDWNGAPLEHLTVFHLAPARAGEAVPKTQHSMLYVPNMDFLALRTVSVGLDPKAVETVVKAGLQPVGRVNNFPGVTPQAMASVFTDLKRSGIKTVIFQGTEVLGFRGLDKDTAALMTAGLNYGQIEFGKQKGDEKLSAALKGEYVRVHSISEAELGTLDDNEAIERYVRAARERNIRLCYIRMLTTAGADPIGANLDYLEKITKGIARHGEMEFGVAHTYTETGVPLWAFALMGVGVAAGLTLLLVRLAPFSDSIALFTLCGALVVCVGAAVGMGEMGRKVAALLAALAFPTLACLLRRDLLDSAPGVAPAEGPVSRGAAAVGAIKGLIFASSVTALGIFHVVGLLATRPFMVKANQFLGIKAAHALPLVLIGAVAIVGLPRLDRPWSEEWAKLRERASRFFDEPARVGQLLITLIALVALALVVARTGNDPGVGVSGIELKFRSLLDRLLPVRPRTKEFLIGHPAFVLGLALWFRGRRKWALPLYVIGVIGQVSLLNTFCHIHTPLHLSLIRDVTGLVFGAVIGVALFWIVDPLFRDRPWSEPLDDREPAHPVEERAPAGVMRAAEQP